MENNTLKHTSKKRKSKKVYHEPSCTITDRNKPNMELMAKAFINFYNKTKNS